MVSLSAIAAKTGRPRGRPRARWVEYWTYSCALFVRDGPTLSWQGGVAATLPPSFLFFVFLLCDRHGRSHALGFYRWGESRAHEIASWHTPWTPLSEVAKAITGTQRIKKVNKQFVRAGCGTRPSREGRAEGGVRSGPLLITTRLLLSAAAGCNNGAAGAPENSPHGEPRLWPSLRPSPARLLAPA